MKHKSTMKMPRRLLQEKLLCDSCQPDDCATMVSTGFHGIGLVAEHLTTAPVVL